MVKLTTGGSIILHLQMKTKADEAETGVVTTVVMDTTDEDIKSFSKLRLIYLKKLRILFKLISGILASMS